MSVDDAICSRAYRSSPSASARVAMTDAMPMTTPRVQRAVRSGLVAIAESPSATDARETMCMGRRLGRRAPTRYRSLDATIYNFRWMRGDSAAVILSAAKDPGHCARIEVLRFAQDDSRDDTMT